MKILLLIRHAKSSSGYRGMSDHSRPLSGRGYRDAVMMGQRMTGWESTPQLLISSSAIRAWSTTELIAGELDYPLHNVMIEPSIYEATVNDLFSVIYALDDTFDRVGLVGHNPGFTQMANNLANAAIDNLPTCSIVAIQFDVAKWNKVTPGKGQLMRYDYPKNREA